MRLPFPEMFLAMAPSTQGGTGGPPGWTSLVYLGLMVVMLYFVMIRPQQKRQREQTALEPLRGRTAISMLLRSELKRAC